MQLEGHLFWGIRVSEMKWFLGVWVVLLWVFCYCCCWFGERFGGFGGVGGFFVFCFCWVTSLLLKGVFLRLYLKHCCTPDAQWVFPKDWTQIYLHRSHWIQCKVCCSILCSPFNIKNMFFTQLAFHWSRFGNNFVTISVNPSNQFLVNQMLSK